MLQIKKVLQTKKTLQTKKVLQTEKKLKKKECANHLHGYLIVVYMDT